jgi:hypothetical protein
MCWANHASVRLLAVGWLTAGVAQPAAKTAMTTKHPSGRNLAPWLSRARNWLPPSIRQPLVMSTHRQLS